MEKKYSCLADEEIVAQVRKGDADAMDYLMTKYRGLVKKEARTMFLVGADPEDLIQEGMIGLFKAIRDYSGSHENSFFGFAKMCIRRQVYSAVTASVRKKHKPLNSYISLYAPVYQEENEVPLLETIRAAEIFSNPEKMVLDKEQVAAIEKGIVERLSAMEQMVLELYLSGLSYIEIAEYMDREPKAIDNAIQRIRKKLGDMQQIYGAKKKG